MKNPEIKIKLDQCIPNGFYLISSRNLVFGVFNPKTKGFVGIRKKFDNLYLFEEYHWDTGSPFGTVVPLEFLEMCPLTDLREGWTEILTPEKREEWIVRDMELCEITREEAEEDALKVGQKYFEQNQELFDWIDKKSKQYAEKLKDK